MVKFLKVSVCALRLSRALLLPQKAHRRRDVARTVFLILVVLVQPGKVVIVLQGRFAGRKAVIVKNFDEGTSGRRYGHALVCGLAKEPRKVRAPVLQAAGVCGHAVDSTGRFSSTAAARRPCRPHRQGAHTIRVQIWRALPGRISEFGSVSHAATWRPCLSRRHQRR